MDRSEFFHNINQSGFDPLNTGTRDTPGPVAIPNISAKFYKAATTHIIKPMDRLGVPELPRKRQ